MAHFPYIRAPGTWITGTAVTPAEFEAINLYIYKAGNFDDGGTWAPAAVITIGGSGQTVTGQFRATDTRDVTVNAAGTLTVNGSATCNGLLNVAGTGILQLAVTATAALNGEVTCSNKLYVSSGGQLSVLSGAGFAINTGATFQSSVDHAASGAFLRTGAGARMKSMSRVLQLTDTSASAGVDYDKAVMTVNGAAAITLTMKITTAPTPTIEDTTFVVHRRGSGAGGLIVQNEGSAAIIVQFTGANTGNALLSYDGTKWRLLSQQNGAAGADASG